MHSQNWLQTLISITLKIGLLILAVGIGIGVYLSNLAARNDTSKLDTLQKEITPAETSRPVRDRSSDW